MSIFATHMVSPLFPFTLQSLKIAFGVLKPISGSNEARMRVRDESEQSSRGFMFQIVSIEVITNRHARLLVTDGVKRAYMFLDYSERATLLDTELKSFARTSDDVCMRLLEGTVFCLEEFYYQPVGKFRSEFPNLSVEDWILYGSDCVDVVRVPEFNHVIFLSECSILGHASTPSFVLNGNAKKRKQEFKTEKELYTVSRLNNLIRNAFWRVEVLLVKIGGVKEFPIKGSSSKIGTCQRFLFRDNTSNIELVVFNDLRLKASVQELVEVGDCELLFATSYCSR